MIRVCTVRSTATLAAGLLLTAGVLPAQDAPVTPTTTGGDAVIASTMSKIVDSAHIDVVFVLDTTGSMSGLIEGAKQKIWSIANAIATAEPAPEVRIGLVGYRDRGDAYVTRRIDLTSDLDLVYAELLGFTADGGGDTPESVNQALHEAVSEMSWTAGDGTLKLVYLVGDAPPHMDYQDDVHYADTCRLAAKSGLIVNTIQCGVIAETTPVWQAIARSAEGEFFAIAQDGGMLVVATPFDEELARLGTELTETVLCYGTAEEQMAQQTRVVRCATIDEGAAATALASRAVWNACDYGWANLVGAQELLADLETGTVKLEDIPEDELPEELRVIDAAERETWLTEQVERRQQLQEQIQAMGAERDQFLRENAETELDAFDARVVECLRRQAADQGIVYKE